MIGARIRNVLLALVVLLWAFIIWDLNVNFRASFPRYETADQIIYYLLVPAAVIAASLVALVLRWRHRFSGADVSLVAVPVLFLPVYLLPLQ